MVRRVWRETAFGRNSCYRTFNRGKTSAVRRLVIERIRDDRNRYLAATETLELFGSCSRVHRECLVSAYLFMRYLPLLEGCMGGIAVQRSVRLRWLGGWSYPAVVDLSRAESEVGGLGGDVKSLYKIYPDSIQLVAECQLYTGWVITDKDSIFMRELKDGKLNEKKYVYPVKKAQDILLHKPWYGDGIDPWFE